MHACLTTFLTQQMKNQPELFVTIHEMQLLSDNWFNNTEQIFTPVLFLPLSPSLMGEFEVKDSVSGRIQNRTKSLQMQKGGKKKKKKKLRVTITLYTMFVHVYNLSYIRFLSKKYELVIKSNNPSFTMITLSLLCDCCTL